MLRLAASMFALSAPFAAHGQVVTGTPSVVDGDTLSMSGIRIRLFGIDAPEAAQTCDRSGQPWACGAEATALLRQLVNQGTATCEQREIDTYGRMVAACQIGYMDLGRAMIDAGLAVALPQAPEGYHESEGRRRDLKLGLWASQFEMPSAYRAAHPTASPRPAPRASQRYSARSFPLSRTTTPSIGSFRNCAEAWALGIAPLYRGSPGYRPEMDGDNDGVACEPQRRR